MNAINVPALTTSPSLAYNFSNVPSPAAVTSVVTLSVSTSRIGSYNFTGSPICFNHRLIFAFDHAFPELGHDDLSAHDLASPYSLITRHLMSDE